VLAGADFAHADLRNAVETENADLTGVIMSFAKLEGADLSRAVLRPEDSDNPYDKRPILPRFLDNATYDDETR
jgi:uncharacterized protein YjbI with pentapeptide repeats